jgi:hypothetical protein
MAELFFVSSAPLTTTNQRSKYQSSSSLRLKVGEPTSPDDPNASSSSSSYAAPSTVFMLPRVHSTLHLGSLQGSPNWISASVSPPDPFLCRPQGSIFSMHFVLSIGKVFFLLARFFCFFFF